MIAAAVFFYIFSAVAVASALMVIASRNPVHSVLFLILTFANVTGLFILLGAEFLGLLLVIVYVGAVAVLFLFVVMMLDVDFAALKKGALQYAPVGALVGIALLAELLLVIGAWLAPGGLPRAGAAPIPQGITNTEALARVLYTDFVLYFQLAGLVLLVAMIGAIVLTLRHKPNVRRQDIARQVARTKEDVIELRKTPFRRGL
ncbi:NADH-quinone oxidoreductase subunit J [Camelimonas abortus]|uniref:NADH-quinone oxidoreductase subunit J n=1 Tax=Camelimonas abortus TaxID=1017184 RepID=A0ABV7LG81_9HYPH